MLNLQLSREPGFCTRDAPMNSPQEHERITVRLLPTGEQNAQLNLLIGKEHQLNPGA